jgi:hypothetical protein
MRLYSHLEGKEGLRRRKIEFGSEIGEMKF